MEDWFKEIDDDNREKVKREYKNARNLEDQIKVLHNWHPKGYLNPEPIKHLEDFFTCIRVVSTNTTWYRGESKEHATLRPKLYRKIKEKEIQSVLKKEKSFFLEFKRRAKYLIDPIEQGDLWSYYFLIQHYGGPTRLLDWTSNAAVALFVALIDEKQNKENPIVYLLQPTTLIDYAFNDIGISSKEIETGMIAYPGENHTEKWIANLTNNESNLPDSPIALLPAYSDPRIISQRSCFTLFGNRLDGFYKDGKQIVCPCCGRKIINIITLDRKSKKSLLNELDKIGISSETVFPGLEGLTKKIYQELFN
jgi:hypothetical protein